MIPSWVANYVGLEFQDHGRGPAFDCWGLARHVLSEEFGVQAPDFGDFYLTDTDEVGIPEAINLGKQEWARVEEGQLGDVVVVNIAGRPMHCGIVVAQKTMLHILPKVGSVLEKYDRPQWARRVEGFYRHPGLCRQLHDDGGPTPPPQG